MSQRGASPLTERQQFWQTHLQRCEAEGLSVRAYTQAHGLSAAAMRSAKRAFKDRARAGERKASTALTLVPVAAPEFGRIGAVAMRLHFPGGVHAEVPTEAAAEVSAALLRTVLEAGR